MVRPSVFILLASIALGCGSTSHGGPGDGDADGDADADADCVDLDHDGAGIGDGCDANDCDDSDPATTDECGGGCDTNPLRKGCSCTEGSVIACYMGPEGTSQGICQAGLKHCEDGVLGDCVGQVLPDPEELCDGKDNNCDGQVDEGVLSACGDCNDTCEEDCVGVGCDVPFNMDDARSIAENADGSLTLNGATTVQNYVIWVANSQQGTVSKINTRTHEEEGRYRTGPSAYPDPSRTTVNPRGDVVVSNRQEGSSTYVRAADCVDKNGNGRIDTSSGTDDILPWGDDECVEWTVDQIPAARGSAFEERAELDAGIHEYVWVCSYPYVDGPLYEIDAEIGEKTGRQIDSIGGYGAAMAPNGLLWTVELGQSAAGVCVTSIDTTTLERTDYACPAGESGYGIAVDGEGRVWIGSSVARLDPETETWESPPANVTGGGITVDGQGNAWVGELGGAWKVDGETMEATPIPGAGGHGWAVDFDGFIWSVDMNDSAHVVDPDTLEVEHVRPPLVGPYTYSDMTGFGLQNTITPEGVYTQIFEGCGDGQQTHWANLIWSADVPGGTAIAFRAKSADTLEEIESQSFVDVGSHPPSDAPLNVGDALDAAGVVQGRYLLLETRLRSVDRVNRPTFSSESVDHSCTNIFE